MRQDGAETALAPIYPAPRNPPAYDIYIALGHLGKPSPHGQPAGLEVKVLCGARW